MILIRKNLYILHRCLAGSSNNSVLLPPYHFLTSLSPFSAKAEDPSPKIPVIVKYLVDSGGLSSAEAIKASKSLSRIKFPLNPDSVLAFFRKNGFTDTDIKRIISSNSRVLYADVDSSLKRKFEVLKELAFSETQIIKLVTTNPRVINYLSYCNVHPRIECLKAFIGSNDDFVKAIAGDLCLVSSSLEMTIKPNIAFLQQCQFSNKRISSLLINGPRVIGRIPNSLKSIAKRVDKYGVPRESIMFYNVFKCFCAVNSDMVDAKFKLLGSLGFSTSELSSAFLKQPFILTLSEKNLSETVGFLVKEAGCQSSYLSMHPNLLAHSLTKRLIPRYYAMKLIMEKGLLKEKIGFNHFVSIPERKFRERFIFSLQKSIPELPDTYLAAAGNFDKKQFYSYIFS